MTSHSRLTRVRSPRATRAGVAVLALSLVLAGCSASGTDEAADESTATAVEETPESSTVTVIDQTKLRLVTAQQTFEARGLVVEVTDATGQGRTVDDPTQWVVVTQTPADGEVERGSTITLDVRRTDDPIS